MSKSTNGITEVLRISAPMSLDQQQRNWPEHSDALRTALRRVVDAGQEFDDAILENETDGNLSDKGRWAGRDRIGLKSLAKLAELDAEIAAGYREHVKKLEDEMFGAKRIERPKDPSERLAYELRLQELRADLRQLDPVQRAMVYCSTEHPMVLDAIETAPPTLFGAGLGAFMDLTMLRDIQLERAKAVGDPATARLYESVQHQLAVVESAISTLRTGILGVAPNLRGGQFKPAPTALQG